jgi:hypothetical protein
MPSLREQQSRFAAALLGRAEANPPAGLFSGLDGPERLSIYRNNVFSNYRNALGTSYPVVCRLVGRSFFDTAVDAFVMARPSTSGDLNVYGRDFGDYLAGYPYASNLPYLADVARLEWAIDEAQRAPDCDRAPREVLQALGAVDRDLLPSITIALDPSCRLVASSFPLLHIWRVNQPDYQGEVRVDLNEGADHLLVRRDDGAVVIETLGAGPFALLRSFQRGGALGTAFAAAQDADSTFDLGTTLGAHIGAGTIASIGRPSVR